MKVTYPLYKTAKILMDKLNKLSLPATIIIASLILGGFFYASQVIKQRSIEKQQQIKIDQERQEQLNQELKLNNCIAKAEDERERIVGLYIELAKKGEWPSGLDFDFSVKEADKRLSEAKGECFKRYPQ